jgi:hypothetical protein
MSAPLSVPPVGEEARLVKDEVLSIGAALVTPSRYEARLKDPLLATGLDPYRENNFLAEAAADWPVFGSV